MIKRGGYRKDFSHRFGLTPKSPPKNQNTKRVWIQAVSVGEAKAIGPLIQMLKEVPGVEITVTTTTSTAYKIIREKYSGIIEQLGIFPIDFWLFNSAAWERVQPDLAILMESELWPEHLHQAKARKVPIILINGRMSDRSFNRYRKLSPLAKWLVSSPTKILASTQEDADRYVELGADSSKVVRTGSIKFDVHIEPILFEGPIEVMKRDMGLLSAFKDTQSSIPNPPLILLGSSTWSGEEAMLLDIFEAALQEGLNCRLLLVPRHAERRDEDIALLKKQNRAWHVRTQGPVEKSVRIYLADTTGELTTLSQVADVAYIGKSMPPHEGGQTPIEAAALGLPIIYGPNMTNFRSISQSLEKAGAAIRVEDEETLKKELLILLQRARMRKRMSDAGKAWHERNRGATKRTFEECLAHLK